MAHELMGDGVGDRNITVFGKIANEFLLLMLIPSIAISN